MANKTKVKVKHYHRPFKPKHRKTILSWSLALNRYRGMSQTSSAKWATTRLKSTTWGLG